MKEITINKIISFLKTPKGIGISLVILAMLFNAVFLWSEVGVITYDPNDVALHLTAAQQASIAIRQNADPTDFWLAQIDLGYSLFHYYQHFPHVVIAVIDQFTSYFISLPQLFGLSIYILLVLFPLSLYWAMRRLGFEYLSAGISAVLVSLISTNTLMGIEYSSYLWMGYGLYTQLWGIVFFPLALVEVYRTLKGNGSWFWTVLLSVIVLLSHLIYGYMLIVSTILFIFLDPHLPEIYSRFKKSVTLFLLTGTATAFFFIPLLSDLAYINRSQFMDPTYYTSYGFSSILNWLFTGNLFDSGRLPVITLLFFVSLVVLFGYRLWNDEKYRLLLVLSFFWLIVYFGPATYGNNIYTVLPFSQNMLFNRFLAGFQFGAIMIIGACLPVLYAAVKAYVEKKWSGYPLKVPIAAVILFVLLLSPALYGQAQSYTLNTQWKTENKLAFTERSLEITAIQNTLDSLPPGRVYAGLPDDFGDNPAYKIKWTPWYALLPQLGYDSFGYPYSSLGLAAAIRMKFDNKRYEQYDLFNIRYVLLAKTWTPAYYYTKIKEFDNYTLYEVPTTGYFDIVDAPAVFYGPKEDTVYPNTKWLASNLVQQKQNPILVYSSEPPNSSVLMNYTFYDVYYNPLIIESLSKPQSPAGSILKESVKMNEYTANFTVTRDSYLMLKTNYHPGWQVTVDGNPVETVILAPGYIGVPVTTGSHYADFVYHPPVIRTPLFIFGILILMVLLFLEISPFATIIPSRELLKK